MSDESFIDRSVVNQFVNDLDVETVTNLMRFFVQDASARMDRIRAAQEQSNWKELEREVHSLGSSAGTQGAIQLMDAARAVEAALRNGDTDEACRDLAAVHELASVSFQALGAIADELEAASVESSPQIKNH
ncbi:MAG: Hpt domain-containing protein [Gammaproteobacteria bacterium]